MSAEKARTKPKEWVKTFQRKLYCAAKENERRRFGILYDKVIREDVLQEAWRRVSRKKGSGGVDRQDIEWIKRYGVARFLEEIREELERQEYRPNNILRVYIPKDGGKKRPLGIPTVRDRVVQMAVKLIIEPLFEADFLPCSHGFRPKRSAHQAVEKVHKHVNSRKWVVDVDIEGYFDTIPHVRLMKCVRRRVGDRRVLHLIRKWLKAGVLEDGKVKHQATGSPQGGVLSPLLSNVYLHEFDSRWDERDGKLVRYADDMVMLCRSREEAERALEKAAAILGELGLKLNEQKTKVRHVREGFDFLGFTFREGQSAGKKRLARVKYPRAKSMKAIRARIKETVKNHPLGARLEEVIREVNPKLRGWANYFRIGNSYGAARALTVFTCEQLRIFWRRRKQRKNTRGRKWPDAFFYDKGLCYVPSLI
jgi:group II intron reverse transcriptase/maturase